MGWRPVEEAAVAWDQEHLCGGQMQLTRPRSPLRLPHLDWCGERDPSTRLPGCGGGPEKGDQEQPA